MKLNLGCGDRRIDGYVGVDIAPPADQIVDLAGPWPWPDSSIDEVLAYSVFEHLPHKLNTMNELWRVLRPGGIARLQLPLASEGDGGFCDPTHRSYWTRSDFEYYHPGFPERERFRNSYGVNADFRIISLDGKGHIGTKRYERRLGGYGTGRASGVLRRCAAGLMPLRPPPCPVDSSPTQFD